MKKLLLILLTYLLVLTCSNSRTIKLPDKNLKITVDIIYYKNEPYTGTLSGTDINNNSARFRAEIKNGIVEGKVELLASDIDFIYNISSFEPGFKQPTVTEISLHHKGEEHPFSVFKREIDKLPETQVREVVNYAILHEIADIQKTDYIGELTGVDILKAISRNKDVKKAETKMNQSENK